MITLDVTTDNQSGIAGLLSGLRAQIPFALSVAINDTVNQAQTAIQNSLGSEFHLRRPDFIANTIFRKPGKDFATKANLSGTVRVNPSRDQLAKFENATTKRSTNGHALAIPIPRQGDPSLIISGRSPLGVKTVMSLIANQGGKAIGPLKKRGAKKAAQQSFYLAKSHTGKTLVIQRTGPTSTRVLYEFVDHVSIDKHRLHFDEIALAVALARWEPNYLRALELAIATMR